MVMADNCTEQEVVTRDAEQEVVARSAEQEVVARSTEQEVVAEQDVVAVEHDKTKHEQK